MNEESIPVSLVCGSQRADLLVSTSLPVAELLPTLVDNLGQLNTNSATYGFQVSASSGHRLSLERTLADQHVAPGAVLTLEPVSDQANERYDDLTEAVGTAVGQQQTPWSREDSLRLSTWSGAILALAGAGILVVNGDGSVATVAVGLASVIILILATRVVARSVNLGTSVGFIVGACALGAATGWNLLAAGGLSAGIIAAAIGMAMAGLSVFALPAQDRPVIAGPLTVSVGLVVASGVESLLGQPWNVAAGVVIALLIVVEAVLPAIGLAMIGSQRAALSLQSDQGVSDPAKVRGEVKEASLAVTCLRIGIGLLLIGFAPILVASWPGATLLACSALFVVLSVRNVYDRRAVLIGIGSAFLSLLVAAVAAVLLYPGAGLVVTGVMLIVIVVLVLDSTRQVRYRPGLDRFLDLVQLLATIAVIPFAAVNWGLF
jgi:type VII secretion integral membrane protein EccD